MTENCVATQADHVGGFSTLLCSGSYCVVGGSFGAVKRMKMKSE